MAISESATPRRDIRPTPASPPLVPTRVDRLIRADDQLRLTIEYLNLDIDRGGDTLVAVDPRQPFTGVRLIFGSQHTVEDPIATGDPVPDEGVDHRTARDSRLVFALPAGTPYALKAILDLAARSLELDDRAVPGRKPIASGEPGADVTALEVVDSLIYSPEPEGRFRAGIAPISQDDVTELWRARLESDPATPELRPRLRAIWSRPDDPPFDRPLDVADRKRIVTATTVDPAEGLEVDQLWLTSHGSFLDLSGAWAAGQLAAYVHRATAGRDLHVEVVERGYLAPFGVPATVTTVTERQFRTDDSGVLTAILVQDDYLSVSSVAVSYPAPHMPQHGRAVPFTQVIAVDPGSGPVGRRTIVLDDGTDIDPDKIWVVTRSADVEMGYAGADRAGRSGITYSLPAVFVADDHAYTVQDEVNGITTPLGTLARYFAEQPAEADLGGQSVGWADPDPRARGGSTRSTTRIRFSLDRPPADDTSASQIREELEAAGRPAFYPRVQSATVVDDTVAALVGDPAGTEVVYAAAWLEHGNGSGNPGLAYHTLVTATAVERTGTGQGLVRPTLRVDTFSQTLGSGIELPSAAGLAGGDNPILQWDPVAALGDAAKLFGSIALAEIVELVNVALDDLGGDTKMPKFEAIIEEEGIFYLLSWEPVLKSFDVAGEPVFVVAKDLADAGLPAFFGDKAASTGSVKLSQLVPFDPQASVGTDFELRLDNVAVRLPPGLPAIAIGFRTVNYHDPADGTATLDTDIANWLFINVLAFLEPVREVVVTLLDLGSIEIGPDGVEAVVQIPIPNLSFGVVGVAGLDVGLALDLPNDGSSTIGFNLSRREDPFRVTVMGFGGTGSLELQLVADDIDFLIASMAVTYELAASVVVVSASLSASLGIELAYLEREVTLTAYVELKGNASILGLVNITGKVLLALSYNLTTKVLSGTAAMSAEVDSLFGHSETSWQQTVEVSLASDSPSARLARTAPPELSAAESIEAPSFEDRFSEAQWGDYCAAFS